MEEDMKRLLEVCSILNNAEIKYWADDGTLLGLMRDSSLIESDNDIDLSIFSQDIEKLQNISSRIEQLGYYLERTIYMNELVVGYSFRQYNKRPINIKIFRKHNNYAWCPTTADKKAGEKFKNSVNPFLKYLAQIHRYINRKYFGKQLWSTWPIQIINFATRSIPIKYLENLTHHNKYEILIPQPTEEYLEYKFGEDWKTPTDNWHYMQDDGCIHNQPPEKVFPELNLR